MGDDDLKAAEERIEKLAERVLVPESLAPNAHFDLFGHTVKARPLPAKYAKMLGLTARDLWKQVSEILSLRDASPAERVEVASKYPDVDQEAATALVRCVEIICEFYKVPGANIQSIEERYTVGQMMRIVSFQTELNEGDDFLLQPLRLTLGVMASIPLITSPIKLDFLVSPSTSPSVKPGESR